MKIFGVALIASGLAVSVSRASETAKPIDVGQNATVYLIAATLFALQATISFGCHFVAEKQAPQFVSSQLQAFCSAIQRFMFLSAIGSLVYAYLYSSSLAPQLLIAWLPDGGPHLMIRNLYWLMTTPVQWDSFAQACTRASNVQIDRLVMYTIMMQLFGLLMLLTTQLFACAVCYVTSCVFFTLMLRQAFALPLLPDLAKVSNILLYADSVIWSLYPLATFARLLGYVSVCTEQVYIFTLLDMVAKSATFTTILATHLLMVLTNIDYATRALKDQQHSKSHRFMAQGSHHDV